MRRQFITAAGLLGSAALFTSTAHAQARHYDCTKAGNANKAVCKAAAAQVPAFPAAAAPATAVRATSARHYDCSKAGNANKAACKGIAPAAPAVAAAAPPPSSSGQAQHLQPHAPPGERGCIAGGAAGRGRTDLLL